MFDGWQGHAEAAGRATSKRAHRARPTARLAALQVSLVEQPEFDFDITLGDSTNVPMEPALKSWIKQ